MASFFSNAKWIGVSQFVKLLANVGGLFLLARLVPKEEFGLMGMAAVVTNFLFLFKDMGTGSAIVQKKDLVDSDTSTIFWTNCFVGLVLALGLASASTGLAAWYGERRLEGVFLLLAVSFPFTSAGVTHQYLLERSSSFRILARIEILSSLLGLLAGVCYAYFGGGVFALVLQTVLTALLNCLQLWIFSKWRPQFSWTYSRFLSLLPYSGSLSLFNFINYFSRNADSAIIGKVLGAVALGPYSMAYKVMLFPLQSLTFVVTRAIFPILSRGQDNPKEMIGVYQNSCLLIAMVTAPLMAGLFVLRDPFVFYAFGEDWAAMSGILMWLAPVGFIQSIVSTTGTVFMATGRTSVLMKLGVLSAFLQVGSFFIGVNFGVVGVAAAYFVANFINAFPALSATLSVLNAKVSDFLRDLAVPVCGSLLMVCALLVYGLRSDAFKGDVFTDLLIPIVLGMCCYGIFAKIFIFKKLRSLRG